MTTANEIARIYIARQAYEAYVAAIKDAGRQAPAWDDLDVVEKNAWANASEQAIDERSVLDPGEAIEIALYALESCVVLDNEPGRAEGVKQARLKVREAQLWWADAEKRRRS